jgi:hypothetical protein
VQFWYWYRSRASAPQIVDVQPYSVSYGEGLQRSVLGRYRPVTASQHVPLVHCGTMQAVPEQPYWQFVHHAFVALLWHTWPTPQSASSCHVPHTRFVVPHSPLVPLQYLYWLRIRASAPQFVVVQPYSVAYTAGSHCTDDARYHPSSQHVPVVHCGGLHEPDAQPYVQSWHVPISGTQTWPDAQLLIVVQLPATSLPVHSPLAPLQYCVIGRVRPSEPHSVPVHPYSVHVRQTVLVFS